MPLDMIAGLATTVVSSILFPYIKEGAAKMAERITNSAGNAASEYTVHFAEQIWNKVKSVFTSDEDKVTITQFEKRPEAAKSLVEEMLKEKLQQDNDLAKELEALVASKSPSGQTGAQIIGATYAGILDMRGATLSGSGNVLAGLNIGHPPIGSKGPGPGSDPSSGTLQ